MNRGIDIGQWLMIAAMAMLALVSYVGFAPPDQTIPGLLAAMGGSGPVGADPFLAEPWPRLSSLVWMLASAFGIGQGGGDIAGLAFHGLAVGALLAGAVGVFRRRLTGGDLRAALLAVLVCCFSAATLTGSAAGLLPLFAAPTPAGLAHLLGMAALLCGLDRRPAAAALAASLAVAVAPPANLIIAAAVIAWMLVDRSLPRRRAMALAVGPLGVSLGMLAVFPSLPPTIAAAAVAQLAQQGGGPVSALPTAALVVVAAAGLGAVRAGTRESDETVRGWLLGLGGVTLSAWIGTLLYCSLPAAVAVPVLTYLDLPAGTKYLTVLLVGLAAARILVSPRLAGFERAALIAAIVVLHPTGVGLALALGLGLLGGLARLLRERLGCAIAPRLDPVALLVPLLLVLILVRIGGDYASPAWIDRIAWRHSGLWSAAVAADEPTWQAWEALGELPDFPLLAIYRNQAYTAHGRQRSALPHALETHPAANLAAGKSPFLPPPGFLTANPALWREALVRRAVVDLLLADLGRGDPIGTDRLGPLRTPAGPLDPGQSYEAFLTERRMAVLVPVGLARHFPAHLPRRVVGTQVLIGFGITP